MSEIVVGDVLCWEPDLEWAGRAEDLHRSLSWAVTIHATVPALPPLRGGELILAPSRTLDELHRNEMLGWSQIVEWLARQPVAGLVVEQTFNGEQVPDVPLLRCPPAFLVDAESRLNREITERRAELYHLGSDLSRALSTASISGADLIALITIAGEVGKRNLLLFDRAGTVVARSKNAPGRLPFRLEQVGNPNGVATSILTGEGLWLVQRTRFADGEDVYLAVGQSDDSAPETVRLILRQTLDAIEAFLRPLGSRRRADSAPSRDSLLADLLLGRVPADLVPVRAGTLGIDPAEACSVALFVSEQPGFDGRIRASLAKEVRARAAMLSAQELAVLVPEGGWSNWWSALETIAAENPGVDLVRSEQQPNLARVAQATRQARALGRLRLAGETGASNVLDLLLPLWDPASFEPGQGRLLAFADALLGPLEAHDRERNSDLVHTLQGYLDAGGSATGAAERLQVHRNTLGYRLKRIGELTSMNLDDADTRLACALAFKVRELQRYLN